MALLIKAWVRRAVAGGLRAGLIALGCAATLLLSGAARADHEQVNRISAYAWFEDSSGKMGLQQVQQQAFTPFHDVLARGFGEAPVWVRLTLDPNRGTQQAGRPDPDEKLVLRIRPVYLDHIELFDPVFDSGKRRVTGDQWPAAHDEFRSVNFNFVIPRGDAPRDIYLRLSTTSSRLLDVEAFSLEDLYTEDLQLHTAYGIYLGVVVLFLFWGVISWVSTRDRVTGVFAISQLTAVLLGFWALGYARELLSDAVSPGFVDVTLSVLVLVAVFAAIWYYNELWREFSPPVWGVRILRAALLVFPLQLVLLFAGFPRAALELNWVLVLFIPIPNFLIALTARGWSAAGKAPGSLVPKKVLVMYFGANLSFLAYTALTGLGVIQGVGAAIYLALIHGLLNGLLAVIFLQYRFQVSRRHQEALALNLALSEQRVAQEQGFRLERDRLFSMLTHELKTPLATIRMLIGPGDVEDQKIRKIADSVNDMNSVIEKSVEMAHFDDGHLQPSLQAVDLDRELTRLIGGCAESDHIALTVHDRQACRIQTDPELFRSIIRNMLSNALKYRAANSQVEVGLRCDAQGGGVEIDVANDPGAVGFPDPGQVFEKYYRAPLSKGFTGSGLGLYLVEGLTNMLSGRVEYRPTDTKVRFVLWLPL